MILWALVDVQPKKQSIELGLLPFVWAQKKEALGNRPASIMHVWAVPTPTHIHHPYGLICSRKQAHPRGPSLHWVNLGHDAYLRVSPYRYAVLLSAGVALLGSKPGAAKGHVGQWL